MISIVLEDGISRPASAWCSRNPKSLAFFIHSRLCWYSYDRRKLSYNNNNISANKEHNTSKLSRKKPAITEAPSCPVPPCNSGAVAILQDSCESPTVCPLCRFEVTGDAIQCDICDQWTHRSCEKISIQDFKNITQATPYTCSLCKMYDEPTTRSKQHVPPYSTTLTVVAPAPSVDAPVVTNPPDRPTMGAKTITPLQMTSLTTNSTPGRESVDVRSYANCAPSALATSASTATTTLQARAPVKVRLSANCASAVNCAPPAAATSASTDTTTLQVRVPLKAANEPIVVDSSPPTALPRSNTPSITIPTTAKATLKANKVAGEDIGVAKGAHTTQDKKNVQWDRELKKRETAVSHAERQMAAQRSTISNLEERLNEVEQSNRLLKLQLATQPPPTNVPQSGMPPTMPQSAHMPPPTGTHMTRQPQPNNMDSLHQHMREQSMRMEIDMLRQCVDSMAMHQQTQSLHIQQQQSLLQQRAQMQYSHPIHDTYPHHMGLGSSGLHHPPPYLGQRPVHHLQPAFGNQYAVPPVPANLPWSHLARNNVTPIHGTVPACQDGPMPPRSSGWRKPRQRLHNRAPRFTRLNQLSTGPRQPEEPTHMATDLIILDVEPMPPCSDIPLAPTAVQLTSSIDHSNNHGYSNTGDMAHLQTHNINDVDPQVKRTHTATDLIIMDVEPIPPCDMISLSAAVTPSRNDYSTNDRHSTDTATLVDTSTLPDEDQKTATAQDENNLLMMSFLEPLSPTRVGT